tara:strand:+ start:182 stop:577 length:396 start_codon:yes stop_codon:yes gene_type:complete
MKLYQLLNRIAFAFLYLNILFFSTLVLGNNTINEELKEIAKKLRCMTCQNQTIYDSDADFSKDIKKIILQKLQKNQNEKEIIDFLVNRYGEYIVFEPQMNNRNIFLWLFPFIVCSLSFAYLYFRIKKNQSN